MAGMDLYAADKEAKERGEKGSTNETKGNIIGGAGGALGGTIAGAAIGSVVPGVETAIGGIVGGIIGGIGGDMAGSSMGGAIGKRMDLEKELKSRNLTEYEKKEIAKMEGQEMSRLSWRSALNLVLLGVGGLMETYNNQKKVNEKLEEYILNFNKITPITPITEVKTIPSQQILSLKPSVQNPISQ